MSRKQTREILRTALERYRLKGKVEAEQPPEPAPEWLRQAWPLLTYQARACVVLLANAERME